MKISIIATVLFLVAVQVYSQKNKVSIITKSGETFEGTTKSTWGAREFKVTSIDDEGKKEKNTVFPSQISKMILKSRTYIPKKVEGEFETFLFDIQDRKYLTSTHYVWEVEYKSSNDYGVSYYNVYYLEKKNKEGFLTRIPSGKRSLIKFLKKKECNKVAKGVETGYLNYDDRIKILKEYVERCVD